MTSGNAHAVPERSSEVMQQPIERGPVPSGFPGAGGANANRPAADVVGSSLAKPQRSRSHFQGMKQDADLARFGCRISTPLALLAQRTRTATANARPIDHAQAAIGFAAMFVREQLLIRRTTQGSISLEGKILPRKATCFESGRNPWLTIA